MRLVLFINFVVSCTVGTIQISKEILKFVLIIKINSFFSYFKMQNILLIAEVWYFRHGFLYANEFSWVCILFHYVLYINIYPVHMYIYIMCKYVYVTRGCYPEGRGGACGGCHTVSQLTVSWKPLGVSFFHSHGGGCLQTWFSQLLFSKRLVS